jgi:hypothetical protein
VIEDHLQVNGKLLDNNCLDGLWKPCGNLQPSTLPNTLSLQS